MTLVNKITYVSVVQFYNMSSVYCIVSYKILKLVLIYLNIIYINQIHANGNAGNNMFLLDH